MFSYDSDATESLKPLRSSQHLPEKEQNLKTAEQEPQRLEKKRPQRSVLSHCTHLLVNSSKDSDATESTAEPNQSVVSRLPEEKENEEQQPRRLVTSGSDIETTMIR